MRMSILEKRRPVGLSFIQPLWQYTSGSSSYQSDYFGPYIQRQPSMVATRFQTGGGEDAVGMNYLIAEVASDELTAASVQAAPAMSATVAPKYTPGVADKTSQAMGQLRLLALLVIFLGE